MVPNVWNPQNLEITGNDHAVCTEERQRRLGEGPRAPEMVSAAAPGTSGNYYCGALRVDFSPCYLQGCAVVVDSPSQSAMVGDAEGFRLSATC
jgi:hypothetical protein